MADITLECTKTYKPGVTHAFTIADRKSAEAMAQVDAEDREYGLEGTWNVEVHTVR